MLCCVSNVICATGLPSARASAPRAKRVEARAPSGTALPRASNGTGISSGAVESRGHSNSVSVGGSGNTGFLAGALYTARVRVRRATDSALEGRSASAVVASSGEPGELDNLGSAKKGVPSWYPMHDFCMTLPWQGVTRRTLRSSSERLSPSVSVKPLNPALAALVQGCSSTFFRRLAPLPTWKMLTRDGTQ
jgi:hypothetical protein